MFTCIEQNVRSIIISSVNFQTPVFCISDSIKIFSTHIYTFPFCNNGGFIFFLYVVTSMKTDLLNCRKNRPEIWNYQWVSIDGLSLWCKRIKSGVLLLIRIFIPRKANGVFVSTSKNKWTFFAFFHEC